MNLENYFAKYLAKNPNSAGSRQQQQQQAPQAEHELPFRIVYPPLKPEAEAAAQHPVPTGPTTDHSNSSERPDGDGGANGRSSKDSPGAAACASALAGPSRAVKPTTVGGPPPRFSVLTDDGEEEEDLLLLGPHHTAQTSLATSTVAVAEQGEIPLPAKRPRDAMVGAEVTPVLERRRQRRRACPSDEDDDELDVLLGKEEAEKVKQLEAVLAPSDEGVVREARECTAVPVSSLNWATRSNRVLEGYAACFARQFEYELQQSPDLYSSFEPFFKDKQLRRIAAADDLHRVFLGPPVPVTADNLGALPGCVLRDYQVQGVQFLLSNCHRGLSCILSDDMGLGKTAQVSAFLQVLRQQDKIDGPHLIIAPLSTLTSWTRELARWAPHLQVLKYHGERKAREQARRSRHNRHAVVVTTPAVLNQDKGFFRKRAWVVVVVDEAHVLKGHDTNITQTARKLHACFRIAVTGTPVHNNVREVWSLMSFLYPSYTAGYGGDDSGDDALRAAEDCARLLRHVMLRRTKESMELGIPPRTDEPVTMLEPTYVQAQVLSQLTARVLQEAEEDRQANHGSSGRQFQAHLAHQRAVCNHPLALRLLAMEGRCSSSTTLQDRLRAAGIAMEERTLVVPSAKMVYLDAMLARLKADHHRCLIFSNFTSTLDLLEAYCQLRHYSYERLDGSCNRVERELSMLRFNASASSCFVFLVTTTAGGVGVTLTGADTVILFDGHFNPQMDRQAADRAHRIGQTRPVHVYRLCLSGTVEEHIRHIADRKASLGDFIVEGGTRTRNKQQKDGTGGGDDGSARLSADDIRGMLELLNNSRRHGTGLVTNGDGCGGTAMSPTSVDQAAKEDGFVASLSQRAAEDGMVADLIRIEQCGLPGSGSGGTFGSGGSGGLGGAVPTTHCCFVCGAIMHPMEPLYHCQVCPKAYHAGCIGLKAPKPGDNVSRHWSCPRHLCHTCGKAQSADGAIFLCTSCPRSFCFDCLDPRYLALDEAGGELLNVKKTYTGMETEGVLEKRSAYYISCLRCCGVLSSSASSSSSSSSPSESGGEEVVDDDEDDDPNESVEGDASSDGRGSKGHHAGAAEDDPDGVLLIRSDSEEGE